MDKKIEKKTWTPKKIVIGVLILIFVGFTIYSFATMDLRSTLNVEREKITVSTVTEDSFQEFIQVSGVVQPIRTIFLDALEGGVIKSVNLESGTNVQQGDTIAVLTNSSLQLSVLQQEASLYDQINNVRNSRLNLEQNNLRLKEQLISVENQLNLAKPEYERQLSLFDKGLTSEQEFYQAKENYEYQKKRFEISSQSFKRDSIQTNSQLRQLDESEKRMFRSLDGVQAILENLIVTAPINGQLTTVELQQGQSINRGERIGQVDILDNYKIRVSVDEFHLSRISTGLEGSFNFAGQTHNLIITKVYPVINNGQFQVDMEFVDEAPSGLRRGQTARIRLELGDASDALLLARGGFYQATGGNWVFKLNEDGTKAVKQELRLGRQNPEYYEVLSGLQLGDKVITSSYDNFGDNEVLELK
ncbi:MAG: HlyD family efflux transporter periplasmic adaptor subunit [Balneola sp.]